MGYLTRKPTSNDLPRVETESTRWVAEALSDVVDTILLLLSDKARRCAGCRAPALLKYLEQGKCPDCRGEKMPPARVDSFQYDRFVAGGYDGEAD